MSNRLFLVWMPLVVAGCVDSEGAWGPAVEDVFEVSQEGEPVGPPGTVVVGSSALVPGEDAVFTVEGAEPGATLHFFVGLSGVGTGPCALGVCLDVLAPLYLGNSTVDGGGLGTNTVAVPPGTAIGRTVMIQVAEVGSTSSASDVLSVITQASGAASSHRSDIQAIWTNNCTDCHDNSPFASSGMSLEGNGWDDIVGVPSDDVPDMFRIRPGSPDDSYLWHKLNGTHLSVGGDGVRMPKDEPALSSADLDDIEQWILDGAAP